MNRGSGTGDDLFRDERAATATEVAVLLSLIVVGCLGVLTGLIPSARLL